MKTTTGSIVVRSALALSALLAASLTVSCKSPLFGLGGQVDTAVPSISVSEVEEGGTPRTLVNGDYVRGAITLRGKASDDLGIASVALSFEDDGSTITLDATIDAAAQTWSADVDTADYLDGDKDFTVTVTDTAGKASTTRFVLYFDNKPPTVLLTVPSADEGTATDALYGTIDIKGSAADQFGIRKVRVYVYDSSKTLIYTSPDDASIGTNSFALRLDTSSMLGETGAEIGYVYVRAWDRSGNTNVQFYRLDEIKALNANLGATVEELHALETGSATSANGITLTQAAGARRYQPGTGYGDDKLIGYSFDQSSNLPVITISNPEEGKAVNLLSKSAKAMGIVQDANGIALVELQFRSGAQESVWYSDPDDEAAGGDIDVSGDGRVVNWSSKVLYGNFADSGFGALDVATYSLRIRATDGDGNVRTSEWVPFTIDADVPYVEISGPAPGDYVGGDPIVVSGTAESYGTTTVSEVAVSINGVFDYQAADIDPVSGAQDVTWSFDLTSALVPDDGTYTVKARVRDSGSKEALYNIVVTVDRTQPHDLAFSSPAKGSSINGYPVLRGQAKDNILLKEVYLVFEKKGEETLLSDTYNWSYELDAGSFANTDYGYDLGNNIYRVPFRIRAVDEAGNESLSPSFGADPDNPAAGSYYLDVDLDGDYPEITTIISPGDENASDDPYVITGSIKVQGTATDDDRLHSVEMALVALSGATESWRSLGSADLYDEVAADTFYPVTGTSLWSQVLNDGGELYALADLAGHAGDFKIIIRAVDTKDLVSVNPAPDLSGDEKTVYVRFDNTLPGVINILPEEGTMQSGTFPLTFTAQDNFSVVLAQISYNNGSSYTTLPITPASSIPLTVSVNTKTVNSGTFATSSGTLYMRIRLKDNGDNITEKSFKYLVDNIAPVDVTPPTSATMTNINNLMYTDAGASLAEILGTVKDTGTVRGLDRVEVYFERAGSIYRLDPEQGAATMAGKSYTFTDGTTALYPYLTDLDDSDDFKIVIDKAENYVDVDGDHYEESLTEGTTGHSWGARFDSSKISDGDVTVHYVAWDQAGNSSHFSVPGSVRNDPPVLTSITLGTNLNGDADATDDGERVRLTKQADGAWRGYTLKSDGTQLGAERAYDLAQPVLTVRNGLFTFAAAVTGGNPALSYRALAPNGTGALLDWVASASYDATNFAINGWAEDDINTLTIQARDSAYGTPLSTEELSFRVRVDNVDGTAPEIALAPVGSRYGAPDAGDSLSYAARAEGAVPAYSDNVLWDDADSSGTCSWDERLGHVELPADSLHDGLDADVSGTIMLRGKVYDDQRVSRITAAFNVGFDTNGTAAGGAVAADTEIELAAFSGGALSVVAARQAAMDPASNALAFALEGKNAPELSDELGHAMNYTLTWNTAFITGVAANNVVVTIRAYNADGSLSSAAARTVDVVPYIMGITTGLESGTRQYLKRSASGSFSINQDETDAGKLSVRISGFNIAPATGGLHIGGGDYTASAQDGSTYADLAKSSITASGAVSVTTNGIQSVNNLNKDDAQSSDGERYNREPSLYGPNYSDDRNLYVWDIATTTWSGRTEAVMKPELDSSGAKTGSMHWMFVNNSQSVQINGGQVASSWNTRGGTFAYNGSGKIFYVFLHDMNWSSGNDGWQYQGSVQWGKGTDDEGGAYNWHRASQDRLGLGNLSFVDDVNYAYADKVMTRYRSIKYEASGDNASTGNFVAYFDSSSISRSIVFWAFHTGTGNSFTRRTTMDNDGGTWYTDLQKYTEGNTGQNYSTTNLDVGIRTPSTGITRVDVTSGSADSAHFDLEYDEARDNAFICYYDEDGSQLSVKWNNAPMTSPAVWSDAFAVDGSSGQYVNSVLDDSGRLHLAYYDGTGSYLKYALVTPTFDGSNDVTALAVTKRVVVDALFTNGMYNAINLREFAAGDVRPIISSYSITYGGTKNSLRVSWPLTATADIVAGASASTGAFTGSWETVTVCSGNAPSQDSTFIETDSTGLTGSIVVGYNAAYIEQATLLGGLYE